MSSESRAVEWTGRTAGTATFVDDDEALHSLQCVLGRKWHPIILHHLLTDGPMRFSELKDEADGISSKMLSESLETLETAGVLDRTLLSDRPVRVEYSLTERGRALEPVISSMVEWGVEYGVSREGDE